MDTGDITKIVKQLNEAVPDQALVVMVGLPGSGKSTLAAELSYRTGSLVVNNDAITAMVHGGNYRSYENRLKHYYKGIEVHAIMAGLATGRSVIIDRCNESRETRRTWVSLGHMMDVPVVVVSIVEPNLSKLLARRMRNSRGYSSEKWEAVIEHRANLMVEPEMSEGFAKIITLTTGTIPCEDE